MSSPGTRVLLAGTGAHVDGSVLPVLPQVARTVTDLGDALITRGGLAPANLHMMIDPAGPAELGAALVEAAGSAEDLLLFYFVGHGVVSLGRELHLATVATRDLSQGLATYQALPFSEVRTALLASRANSTLIVLDCCFSGRARGALGNAAAEAFKAGHVEGAYLLTATANNESALSPPEAEHTAFSGTLLSLLREGDPGDAGAPPALTLDYLVARLRRRLAADGLPRPRNQAADRVGELVLAPNPAWRPPRPRPDRSPGAAPDDPAAPCPYPGLVPFEAADAALFFGRDDLTDNLIDLAGDGGPVVVVGPSGAGKSSLLRAGLLGTVGPTRPTLLLTPTARPTDELRNRLRGELPDQPADAGIAALVDAAPGPLLIVVDQFEELFTACTDERERAAYIATLCSLNASIVLGVRADFYGRLAHYPQLLEIVTSRQIVVGPLTQDQVRTAIERPATAAGLTLEDGLCDLVLRDYGRAGADSSPLPFLAHALRETWRSREGRLLTYAGYETSGGIWRAVRSTADAVYAALGPDDRRTVRDVLLRMVRIDENNDHTRRRLDLRSLPAPAAAHRAVAALVEARLVTLHGGDVAEISHEAMIRAWPMLTGWIEADRAALVAHQRLSDAAETWKRERHDPNLLYQGARLADAESHFDGAGGTGLGRGERDFLDASRVHSRRRTRRLRQVIALLTVLLLIAVGAGLFAVVQWRNAETQTRRAISEQLTVQARALTGTDASLATLLDVEALNLNGDNGRARADLAHSLIRQPRHTGTVEAGDVRRMTFQPKHQVLLTQGARGLRLWSAGGKELGSIEDEAVSWSAFGPDGTVLGVVAGGGRSALWRVTEASKPARLAALPVAEPTTIAFAAGNRLAAVTTSRFTTVMLDVSDPARPTVLGTVPTRGDTPPESWSATGGVIFSPDGTTMATGSDGTIVLWDVTRPATPRPLATFTSGSVRGGDDLSFNATGTRLAVGGGNAGSNLALEARTEIWDVRDRRRPVHRATVVGELDLNPYGVLFSPDPAEPDLLVIAGSDGVTTLWDLTDPAAVRQVAELTGGTGTARSDRSGIAIVSRNAAAVAGDGRMMATAPDGGVVHLWDRSWAKPVRVAVLPAHGPVDRGVPGSVAFSPDRLRLVSAVGGRGALWSVDGPPSLLGTLDPPAGSPLSDVVAGAAFRTPDTVLTTGRLGGPTLWGLRDPRRPQWLPVGGLIERPKPGISTTAAISPDGTVLATAPDPRLMTTAGSGMYTADLHLRQRHPGPVGVAFSPKGSLLAVVDDRLLSVWTFATDVVHRDDALTTRQLSDRGTGPLAGAFSADGRVLLTASGGRTELWRTGVTLVRLSGLPAPRAATVRAAAFSADGPLLATADATRTSVWSVARLDEPTLLAEIPVGVSANSGSTALAFGRDNLLAIAAPGGTQLWDLSAAARGLDATVTELTGNACAVVGPGITELQWNTYIPQLGYGPICD